MATSDLSELFQRIVTITATLADKPITETVKSGNLMMVHESRLKSTKNLLGHGQWYLFDNEALLAAALKPDAEKTLEKCADVWKWGGVPVTDLQELGEDERKALVASLAREHLLDAEFYITANPWTWKSGQPVNRCVTMEYKDGAWVGEVKNVCRWAMTRTDMINWRVEERMKTGLIWDHAFAQRWI